jgi:hypothetical protein
MVVVLFCALLGVSACAKKVALDAPQSKRANQELAVTQRAANSTLAYEHEVTLRIDRDQLAQRVEATRAACSADSKSGCAIVEVSIGDSGEYTGRIRVRLAPAGVDALVNVASVGGQVVASQTSAEDLAQPLADVGRQLTMQNAYRDRLAGLLVRKDTSVADLITVSKELSVTQTQIEELTNQNVLLRHRIDTDLLTIVWHVPAAQARSDTSPIRDALSTFGANFTEAIGDVIEFLAQLVPWLIVGLPALILLRMFWRWTGNWLSRKVRMNDVQA